jgi:hypothetical protein
LTYEQDRFMLRSDDEVEANFYERALGSGADSAGGTGLLGPSPMTTLSESVAYAERMTGALRASLPAGAQCLVGPRVVVVTLNRARSHALLTGDDVEDRATLKTLSRRLRGPSRWDRIRRALVRAACW